MSQNANEIQDEVPAFQEPTKAVMLGDVRTGDPDHGFISFNDLPQAPTHDPRKPRFIPLSELPTIPDYLLAKSGTSSNEFGGGGIAVSDLPVPPRTVTRPPRDHTVPTKEQYVVYRARLNALIEKTRREGTWAANGPKIIKLSAAVKRYGDAVMAAKRREWNARQTRK
jgi:hypothetical protein